MSQPYTREYIARLQHEIDGIEKEMGPSAEIDKQRKNLAAMDKNIVEREKAQKMIEKGDKLVATGSLLKSIGKLLGESNSISSCRNSKKAQPALEVLACC